MRILALVFTVLFASFAWPDTLVVCPGELRPALALWETYRKQQGHVISVIEPPSTASALRVAIRRTAAASELRYLLLVGEVPAYEAGKGGAGGEESPSRWHNPQNTSDRSTATVPTNYLPAKVNIRWGSAAEIASDMPYADINGDGRPDLAVGRIPVRSADQLAAVVRKLIRYEQESLPGDWQRRVNLVAGAGGFGAATDAIIEAAGRRVIQQTVPTDYVVRPTFVHARGADRRPVDWRPLVREQLSEGCLVWVYAGHALPSGLDRVATSSGDLPLLSIDDVRELRCGAESPLVALMACHAGAIDSPGGCLGGVLVQHEAGPVAVIAATRVTMPYGNTVLGYELLRVCFGNRPALLGDLMREAQHHTLDERPEDVLRPSLDALARGLSPPPVDLAAERLEHVWMYQLLGDPLLRLRLPGERVAELEPAPPSER